MSRIEKLSPAASRQILTAASEQAAELTVTVKRKNQWLTFRSNSIFVEDDLLWITPPASREGPAFEYQANEEVGLMFQLGPDRYLFSAKALGQEQRAGKSGPQQAICLKYSGPMQRSYRRLHERVSMPAEWQVCADFWLGGREAEPAEDRADLPVWSGQVENLSRGGMLLRVSGEAAGSVELDDIVGARLNFGADGRSVYLDARLRHQSCDGHTTLLGFEFVHVETEYAREAIALIAEKIQQCDSQ